MHFKQCTQVYAVQDGLSVPCVAQHVAHCTDSQPSHLAYCAIPHIALQPQACLKFGAWKQPHTSCKECS